MKDSSFLQCCVSETRGAVVAMVCVSKWTDTYEKRPVQIRVEKRGKYVYYTYEKRHIHMQCLRHAEALRFIHCYIRNEMYTCGKRHIPLFWWICFFLVNMSLFGEYVSFRMYTSRFSYTKKSIMGIDLLCCRSRKRPGQSLSRSLSRWLIFCLGIMVPLRSQRLSLYVMYSLSRSRVLCSSDSSFLEASRRSFAPRHSLSRYLFNYKERLSLDISLDVQNSFSRSEGAP